MGPHKDPQGTLEGLKSSSNVKEKVQGLLNQLAILPGLEDMHKPNFDYLLECDPNAVIFCTPHPHLA